MKIEATVKPLPQSEVEITVSVAWEDWQQEIDHAAKHLAEDIKIAGFRKGKVPREILEQKVGKHVLMEEAAEHAIQHIYPHVLEQEQIDAIGRPQAEIRKAEEGETLEFVVKTAVVPTLTLGEWRSAVKKVNKEQSEKEVTVSDEDVDKELGRLAESRAKLVTVDREAKNGDTAVLDFQVFRDGVAIEGGTSKQHPIVLGSGAFIPGFEDQVVGMKAGEEKSFELSFPEKYHAKDLAGRPATFQVKVTAVQEREISALDDEFAKSIGKFETIEDLRKSFREGMQEEKKAQAAEEHRTKVLDALTETAQAELPRILIDEELVKMLHEFEYQIQHLGMDFETYLKGIGKEKDALYAEWEPQAAKRVLAALALEEVAKEQEIEPSHDEVEMEMNKMLQYYRNVQDIEKKLDMTKLYQHASGKLRNDATFAYLEKL